jgi:hypothetical protein
VIDNVLIIALCTFHSVPVYHFRRHCTHHCMTYLHSLKSSLYLSLYSRDCTHRTLFCTRLYLIVSITGLITVPIIALTVLITVPTTVCQHGTPHCIPLFSLYSSRYVIIANIVLLCISSLHCLRDGKLIVCTANIPIELTENMR